jgi:mono/diheme cytochrome c family protein
MLIASAVMAVFLSDCNDTPYKQGKILYQNFCASCHMEDGSGLAGNIPPLAQTDWVKENQDKMACVIRYGIEGEIKVNGRVYNNPMAGISRLSAFEVTNIINYINHAWGNTYGYAKYEDVKSQLENCPDAN